VTREALAELALRTLDAQRHYFSTRNREDLIVCKQLEAQLRHACIQIRDSKQQEMFSPEASV